MGRLESRATNLPAGDGHPSYADVYVYRVSSGAMYRANIPVQDGQAPNSGMVFPDFEIQEIDKQEGRSLQRFDADFDLPDHLLPEFPPPSS